MRTLLAAVMLLATSMLSTAMAQEVGKCAPDKIVAKELQTHKQFLVTFGFINAQALYALYASKGGSEWTSVIIRADQVTCIIAKGTELYPIHIEPKGDKV